MLRSPILPPIGQTIKKMGMTNRGERRGHEMTLINLKKAKERQAKVDEKKGS